jgi:hypothetical protein
MAKFTGKGSSFFIKSSGATPTYTAVGQVQSIGGITISSDEVEVTTLDAGDYRQYIQGFKDPGECPIVVLFDPALADQGTDADGLLGLFASGEVRDVAIQVNSSDVGGKAYLTFKAFIRDWEYGEINADDPQTVTPTFRITGAVTVVDTLPTTLLAAQPDPLANAAAKTAAANAAADAAKRAADAAKAAADKATQAATDRAAAATAAAAAATQAAAAAAQAQADECAALQAAAAAAQQAAQTPPAQPTA